MVMKQSKPNLFLYDDYRKFLNDTYLFHKSHSKGFSFRSFAKSAGLTSPNYLKMVTLGQRNLSLKTIRQFSVALELSKTEEDFFESLVLFNQSTSAEEQSRFYERMAKNRRYKNIRKLDRSKFEYYSHWYYAAIRELVGTPDFKEDPEWISQTLVPPIRKEQAKEALILLQQLHLIKRNDRSMLEKTDQTVSSGAETASVAVKAFHREMLRIASDVPDRVPANERDISGVMMRVHPDKLEEFKKKLSEFRQYLLTTMEADSKKPARLYQLNIQLFPLTRKDPT